jgi:hypothetical protein
VRDRTFEKLTIANQHEPFVTAYPATGNCRFRQVNVGLGRQSGIGPAQGRPVNRLDNGSNPMRRAAPQAAPQAPLISGRREAGVAHTA